MAEVHLHLSGHFGNVDVIEEGNDTLIRQSLLSADEEKTLKTNAAIGMALQALPILDEISYKNGEWTLFCSRGAYFREKSLYAVLKNAELLSLDQ